MNEEISPRVKRSLRWQFVSCLIISILVVGGLNALFGYFIDDTVVKALLVLVGSIFICRPFFYLSAFIINMIVYKGDVTAMRIEATTAQKLLHDVSEESSAENNMEEAQCVEVKIVATPEKPLGRFMNADFFEWLDVKCTDGKIRRIEYEHTVNLEKGLLFPIPKNHILLPPGILYKIPQT